MVASLNGLASDPVLGIMALLSVACTGYLAVDYLREQQRQRKMQRVRARLRQKHLGGQVGRGRELPSAECSPE